ncbi:MAG: DUF547 domain-containing protein [Burkholderiales bacterium]
MSAAAFPPWRLLAALSFVFAAGCAQLVPAPSSDALPLPLDRRQAEAAWARVLDTHVDEQGRIDFAGVAANRADLDRFVAFVYAAGPGNRPELFHGSDDVLAFHINAYNALAMFNILDAGIPESLAGWRKVPFFALKKLAVGGVPISLYDYENDVIRKLDEERIHFALNCMVVGCPRLPRAPFVAEKLREQLNREAHNFFAERRNVAIDDERKSVHLSEIMRFYTEDFLKREPSLARYVSRYRDRPIPDTYSIRFIPYDWTVNRRPALAP